MREKNVTIPQLNEFLRQDTYDKRHGKNLIPKQTTETQMKTEPIQKTLQTRNKKQKMLLLRCIKLDNRTHMSGKKEPLQQMQKERPLCSRMQIKNKLYQQTE